MKKIININLAGRVIPIEDSAFESLQRYIESLRRYFAHEEGRDEIINDIESRIAELMNDKIRKGATAITDADIDQIVASMGRIEDFEQTDAADAASEKASGTSTSASYTEQTSSRRSRGRLYRDTSDKILGGVCSGIANYFNVDPAIVRVLFALLVFGAGSGVLIYILLWIILPAKPDLPEPQPRIPGKRFFRNPDDRIIGGVAGGLAAYFNKEAWIFRLIFAGPLLLNIIFGTLNGVFFAFHRGDMFPTFFIGSFTGTFIIAYIVLWIILPEAKTPYDKMEMRGENVDVNTIRQNVQEGMSDFKGRMKNWSDEVKSSAQNLGDRAKETFGGAKGKQFASDVSQSARRVGNSFGHIIGVIIKAFFLFIAGSIAFGLFIALIVIIFGGGIAVGAEKQHLLNFFLSGFWQHAFFWGTIIFFFLVPVIAFITWLIRRIMKVRSQKHYLGYIFGGLWFIGFISICCLVSSLIGDFRRGQMKSDTVTISQPKNDRMIVTINEPEIRYTGDLWFIDTNSGWDITEDSLKLSDIRVRVAKSEDTTYSVTVQRYGRGRTVADALNRAERIVYNVNSKDSFLLLGSGFSIDRESKYRAQRIVVEIKVPVGKKINFDETVLDNLNYFNVRIKDHFRSRRYRRDFDFDWNDDEYFAWKTGVDYVMTAGGTLKEVNAPDQTTPDNTNKNDSIKRQKPKNSTGFYKQEQKREVQISIPIVPSVILVEGFS